MKKIKIYLLFVMFIDILPIQAQNFQYKTYADSAVVTSTLYANGNSYQKDFLLFINLLKSTHPAFAPSVIPPFNIDSISNQGYLWATDCKSTDQLKVYLQSIAVLLNDGHTTVLPSTNRNAAYPFALYIDEKDFVLYAIDEKFESFLGKKISHINHYPISDVIMSFKSLISSDNEAYFLDKVNGYMQFYDSWKYNPYRMPDSSLIISFVDSNDIILHPISAQNFKISSMQVKTQDKLITAKNRKPFSYVILPEQSICYFQFNQCVDQSDVRYKYEMSKTNISQEELEQKLSQYPRFDTLVYNMFHMIEQQQIKTLVIDVRNNAGGNSKLCNILLSWLTPFDEIKSISSEIRISALWEDHYSLLSAELREQFAKSKKSLKMGELYEGRELRLGAESSLLKKMDEYFTINTDKNKIFKGDIVFVQGAKTFSSAGMLIIEAVDNHIGTVIGSSSTYKPCSYGDLLGWELPNTKIQGFVSHKIFNRPNRAKCHELAITPEVYIKTSFSNILNGKDSCWDWIIEKYSK